MGCNEADVVRLARPKGKNADECKVSFLEKIYQDFEQYQDNFLILLK
jgi:hypothetical protein